MLKFLRHHLFRTAPEAIIEDQLYEARRLALDHQSAAEYHTALAAMYDQRVERLVGLSKMEIKLKAEAP